uniref:Uncharacterized protein n=1 Tax=Panagrolaimus superbus TaxID=310955 RepID=A0A914YIG1_9BILA
MSPATLKSTLKLSPSSAAAKRVFDRALNKRKKKVKFCKIIHKKNITPLDSKIKRRSFGEYFDGGDPALSFTELTDHSIQSFGNKQTSAERINSPVIEVVLKRQRRRSNLFLKMSGSNSSIKTFFSPRPIKRSVPSMPDNEDAEVLFVNEVINTQKTSSSDHSSSQEPVVISLSDSTLEESVIIDPIVTRPTPKLWIDAFIPKKKSDIIHGPPMDIFIEWLKCWKKRLILLAKLENEPPKKKRKSRKHEEDSDYEPEKETDELCSTIWL